MMLKNTCKKLFEVKIREADRKSENDPVRGLNLSTTYQSNMG